MFLKSQNNLISIHELASHNLAFLEYYPNYFVIKDQVMRRPLLRGRFHNGIYPLLLNSLKQAFAVSKSSVARQHSHLGHPSTPYPFFFLKRDSLLQSRLGQTHNYVLPESCQCHSKATFSIRLWTSSTSYQASKCISEAHVTFSLNAFIFSCMRVTQSILLSLQIYGSTL